MLNYLVLSLAVRCNYRLTVHNWLVSTLAAVLIEADVSF